MNRLKDLIGLVKNYKRELAINLLLNVLNAIFSLFTFASVMPFLYILFRVGDQKAPSADANPIWIWISTNLNELIAHYGQMKMLLFMCLAIIILALLKNLVNYLSLFSIAKIRTSISRDMRERLYRKILDLPLAYFSNERKGDIISRMTNDLMEIEFSIIGTLEAMLKSPVMIIASLITLIALSWKMTLLAFVFLPVSGFAIAAIAKTLKNAAKRGKGSLGELISVIEETITGLRIIKVFNADAQFKQKFDRMNDYYFRLMHRLYKREYLSSPMSEFISLAVISVLLYFGGSIVVSGEMGGEMLISYLLIFSQIIQPAKALSDAFFKISKGAASLDRVNEILDAPITITDKDVTRSLDSFKDKIEFKNIRFGYQGEEVIKGINLTIEKGQTVALVGPSGSGKSTMAALLARFYDPTSGEVCIDGIPLTEYKMSDVRALMGYVAQDSILFNDSIRNNIALGTSGIQQEKVERAARIANAEEFIVDLPGKYDFNVGDAGNKLSGGQKQRISIARAVFKNPPILILDEATSALDTQSEKWVQDAINKLMENRTSLVIAHRLSTIQKAHKIVVIEAGNIVEQGTHEELMAGGGLYKRLVDMQTFG